MVHTELCSANQASCEHRVSDSCQPAAFADVMLLLQCSEKRSGAAECSNTSATLLLHGDDEDDDHQRHSHAYDGVD